MSQNQKIINMLEKMEQIMFMDSQPFKARAYQKAKDSVIVFKENITSAKQVEGMKGFRKGGSVLKVLNEFITTGEVQKIVDSATDMRFVFNDVYGIGPKCAKKLVNQHNVQSIEELRERQDELLNDVQKKGLRYYEDVLKRIPRKEINLYNKVLHKYFNQVKGKSKSEIQIVGSWRRGAKTSGDIDVIISNQGDVTLFHNFIDKLIEKNILVEVLSRGDVKTLGISKLSKRSTARRIDFMFTPKQEFPFAVLYFTGSKIFNTLMRKRALELNYTMNEHGINYMVNGKKQNKVEQTFRSEQDIFSFLGIEYREPKDRENGTKFRLVESKEQEDTNTVVEGAEEEPIAAVEGETKSPRRSKRLTKKKALKKEHTNKATSFMLKNFRKKGISFLKKMTEKQFEEFITFADNQYYIQNKPIMTDEEYDVVREFAENKFKDNEVINKGHEGVMVEACKNKIQLPYFLGSMDKIKPDTKVLANWIKKYPGPYHLSAKLDGMSALYINDGGETKLYTRGCGNYGFDISHLIPFIKVPDITNKVVRGELIITKKNFKKFSGEYSNERSFAAAMVNGKKLEKKKVKYLDFVAYELIQPVVKPSLQYGILKKMNFITVINIKKKKIDQDILSQYLMKWRESYSYIIDGVICIQNKIYERKLKGNPSHAFAFKKVLSDQIVESRVVDVIWSTTQYGYVKPKIQMEPVKIGGVKITYATAHNAKFIKDNKIGIGSVIQVVRSGDVIPKVHKVVKPAVEPKYPSDMTNIKWNKSGVDLILIDKENDVNVQNKTILGFFKKINVDGLKEGNLKKIIRAGYDTIGKIIAMEPEDFMEIQGFKEKMSAKIYNSIQQQVQTVPLSLLMDASNMFGHGMGENRIKLVLEQYPDILVVNESSAEKREMIMEIDGFAEKTAMKFVKNINKFKKFLKENNLEDRMVYEVSEEKYDESHPLYGKKILMSGFRSEDLKEKIRSVGAEISSSVSKNLDILIVKDENTSGGKLKKAQELGGIEIFTRQSFEEQYFDEQ